MMVLPTKTRKLAGVKMQKRNAYLKTGKQLLPPNLLARYQGKKKQVAYFEVSA